jgi:uncharacterized protein
LDQRLKVNKDVTLKMEYEQCLKTGRFDSWKLNWKPGMPNKPHVFWDSDVAKWIEAAAYSLPAYPDKNLEEKVDDVVDLIISAQQEDGYLNSYFTCVAPEKRWTNLRDLHELYCAGHLIEAAVAYYEAAGKDKLLNSLCKYADYIYSVFGEKEGQLRGYPGHEEIELALVKLYRVTKNKKYLELAKYFIDERGVKPDYFEIEERKRNSYIDDDKGGMPDNFYTENVRSSYYQGHLPVREQTTAEGHSVRACYLYAGMVDIANETNDSELFDACRKIWNNIIQKRMYIHGGIGSANLGERFSFDYDLPNELAYAETCAAISLVFFGDRMLQKEVDTVYSDVIERALYNCILAGVSIEGDKFFYHNVLACYPKANNFRKQYSAPRQEWFDCACCPPNLARFLASLGDYIYSQTDDTILTHLYISGSVETEVKGSKILIEQRSNYPWDGDIIFEIKPENKTEFILGFRIPEWCKNAAVKINNEEYDTKSNLTNGYVYIERTWTNDDIVEINLPMFPVKIKSNPAARENCGRIALQRGPVLYCIEETDNGCDLNDIRIPVTSELKLHKGQGIFKGIPIITADAIRTDKERWKNTLYSSDTADSDCFIKTEINAVPYFMWANREVREMLVWIRE